METNNTNMTAVPDEVAAAGCKSRFKDLNVYQKLQLARIQFMSAGAKKSGKNMSLEFTYFELADIVPIAESIFNEVGLFMAPISIYPGDEAHPAYVNVCVINTDDPTKSVDFTLPYTPVESNRGTNAMMATGSSITYIRRYAWMCVLDIVEPDTIEATAKDPDKEPKKGAAAGAEQRKPQTQTAQKATKKTTRKAPPTESERKDLKVKLTGGEKKEDGNATEEQLKKLATLCGAVMKLDEERAPDMQKIALATSGFKKAKADVCAGLITKVAEIVKQYKEAEKK